MPILATYLCVKYDSKGSETRLEVDRQVHAFYSCSVFGFDFRI
jgi:hypothetical protein